MDYAKSLPELNPVREAALRDFTAENIMKRGGMGAAEGALGGLMGADLVNVAGRSGSATGSLLSRVGQWLGRTPPLPKTTSTTLPGTVLEEGALSPTSTAGGVSSGSTRQAPATGPSDELVRVLAQGRLPASSGAPNSDDLLRALANPANRNVPKAVEVKRAKDKLGRPYAKDPDDGRFTSDPDR